MKKAGQFALLGILLLIAGCKKDSQSQQVTTSGTPPIVQAAAPAAPEAPQPVADTASPSGLMTPCSPVGPPQSTCYRTLKPLPSVGQFTEEGIITSIAGPISVAVGNAHTLESADDPNAVFVFMALCIHNRGKSPFLFKPESISVSNAKGSPFFVLPKEAVSQNPKAFSGFIRGGYWGNDPVAANSNTCHNLIVGGQTVTAITVHVPIETQALDFAFVRADDAQTSVAAVPALASPSAATPRTVDPIQVLEFKWVPVPNPYSTWTTVEGLIANTTDRTVEDFVINWDAVDADGTILMQDSIYVQSIPPHSRMKVHSNGPYVHPARLRIQNIGVR